MVKMCKLLVLPAVLAGVLLLADVKAAGILPEVIVIPDTPTAVEQTAARELAEHLNSITGKKFTVVKEASRPAAGAFLVGNTAAAKKEFPQPFGYDGIAIRTVGKDIILTGHPRRGTLYAVYTLLEKYAGVRWYTSDVTKIPDNKNLSFADLNEVYTPKLRMRETHYTDAYVTPFAARIKNNGHFVKLPAEYGGNEMIIGFCHTFAQIIPPGKYFKSHPEWFPLINGKRCLPLHNQLCLTNEEMRKEFIKNTFAMIAKHPEARIISISQNDGGGRCMCPECAKIEAEEGSPAGLLLRFVNAVAVEIEKKYPDMLIDTLAYTYTRKAPKITKPAKNVSIRYCDIEADFSRPIATGKYNVPLHSDISEWGKIAPNMLAWHYTNTFSNVMLPYPTWMNYATDINYYINQHAVGLFLEGNSYTKLGDFTEMRAWVLSHLLWDPSLDQNELMTDFLNGYYGPAAKDIREYLDFIAGIHQKSGKKLGCFAKHVIHWLSIEDIVKADHIYKRALAAVKNDFTLTERVLRARSSLDYAALLMYPYLQSQKKIDVFTAEEWLNKAHNVSYFAKKYFTRRARLVLAHWNNETGFHEMLAKKETVPAGCENLPRDRYVDFQDNLIDVAGLNRAVFRVDDPEASDGKALKVVAPAAWFIQCQAQLPTEKGKKWKFLVRAKIYAGNLKPNTGIFSMGCYNGVKEYKSTHIFAKDITTDKYMTFELPAMESEDGLMIFIMPRSVSRTRPLYIDRITVVRE